MATVKISALPPAAVLDGSELVPAVQSSSTVKTTTQDIADLAPAGPTLPLAIAQGGTGQITRQLALDALFGGVAKGSLWLGDGAHITALPVGADGTVLTANSGQPEGVQWAVPAAAGVTDLNTITGSVTLAGGHLISVTPAGSTLTVAVSSSVVGSLNGLENNVTLAAGTGITITPAGNTLIFAAPGAGVTDVNAINGSVTLAAGTGINITPAGSTLTIAATGSGLITATSTDGSLTPVVAAGNVDYVLALGHSNAWTVRQTWADGTFTVAIPDTGVAALTAACPGSSIQAQLATAATSALFIRGTASVGILDGVNAISVTAGHVALPGTSGNTFWWGAPVAAPTASPTLALPLNTYGPGAVAAVLGTPDAWVLISINGTDYRVPAYL